jgi:dipeptidyl aminopeptidase/acylaminoacyl peptidase
MRAKVWALMIVTVVTLAACSAPEPPDLPSPSITGGPLGGTLQTLIDDPAEEPVLEIVSTTDYDVVESHDITYRSDGLTITGVLHVPTSPGPHPAIVMVHGLVDASTYTTGNDLTRQQRALVEAGYIVLVPDLRGHAGSDDDPEGESNFVIGQAQDIVNALRALRSSDLPGLDTDRIALLGHSFGGLGALNAAVVAPDLYDALILISPAPTDLWMVIAGALEPDDPVYQSIVARHGTPDTQPEHWADLTPLNFVDRIDAPVLVVQGTADEVIQRSWTETTVAALQDGGVAVDTEWIDGADHHLDPYWEVGMDAIFAFLDPLFES